MNRNEALMYLDADEENWQETLELKLFELKKDLFQRVVIPKVLIKRAEKVSLWYQAECQLNGEEVIDYEGEEVSFELFENLTKTSLINLYRSFESKLTALQLKLSQSVKSKDVAIKLMQIANLELSRQKSILPFAKEWLSENLTEITIKMGDDIKTGVIISELNQLDKEELSKKDLLLLPNFKKDLERTLISNK